MSEAKPRLVWVAEHDDDSDYLSVMERLDTQGVYEGVTVCRLHDEAAADLIADAGTVFNTTGLTPSQIVERVKELEELLNGVLLMDRMYSGRIVIEGWQEEVLHAALSKARPNTAEGAAQVVTTNSPAEIVELLDCSGCLKAHMKERALATVTRILSAQHGGEL